MTETNKGKKSLMYDGYTYKIDRILKENDISWRCTNIKRKQTVMHAESKVIIKSTGEHYHENSDRKLELLVLF